MKRIVGLALLSLALVGLNTQARAQDHALIVNVPFAFAVGEKLLPAGTYTVISRMPGYLKVESADKRQSAMIVGTQSYYDPGSTSKLIFNEYGDRYFLHRVLCPNAAAMNADLPISNLEKRVRSDFQRARLATNERVLLAGK